MDRQALEHAAFTAGIATSYIDMRGEVRAIGEDTLLSLLAAMNIVDKSNNEYVPLPVVMVGRIGEIIELPVTGHGDYHWELLREDGRRHSGQVAGNTRLRLPRLDAGYHQLTLSQDDTEWQCQVIVAPKRCYQPSELDAGRRLWGACVQLYTLRSDNNWGIGDFSDLRTMLREVGLRGGDFVGVNPLHSLYPARPDFASPYSPSSRLWLNPLYIDVSAIEDFAASAEAQSWWNKSATRKAVETARSGEWVDYPLVTRLKLHGLRLAWQQFNTRAGDDSQAMEFDTFILRRGDSLYWQAAYDALCQYQSADLPESEGWGDWPGEYQDIHSSQVAIFCRENGMEIRFWQWLQWQASRQLEACQEVTEQGGMAIGLYRDLAVGVSSGGADTWYDRKLYCLDASVGAPPDALGPQGQNWNLPPLDPQTLRARAYQPFIQLIRANMACCGALRIDHVMSLLRLWWIPRGKGADAGAYVHYPVDDLLAILALESQRHRCLVIGEDLGTVPEEIIDKLRSSGVYSYKVLYFERTRSGAFRAPGQWPAQAIGVTSTHDLPTLRGYWQGGDLALGKELGIYPDQPVLDALYRERSQARQALLDNLHRYGCLAKKTGHLASRMAMSPALSRGMQRYVALSASRLLGLQPEDWLGMSTPVNVPGTSNEYPNWRRKLTRSLEEMFADAEINRLLKDLTRYRHK
ncbi:4-alpha-glucanotransferase [Salmonella enterica subsp. enterica serovar Choleraesuis]|nr:4-alpha-glucanotransferase [Salmonella enterica subsp. enterica serovar Choleraesuis]